MMVNMMIPKTNTEDHYDDVLKEFGLEMREEMEDVDGEQTMD